MLSVAQARERILERLAAVDVETVSLSDGWQRVLAADLAARLTHPPADMSAMDGYAMRAADAGATLRVVGAAPAGRPFAGVLKWGEAVRLFTGSVLPAGADCVLLQEDALAQGDTLSAQAAPRVGQHIRRQGQDFALGDVVLRAGTRLGAREIGLAAAANHAWLQVHRRPRVAILATGDEIALPGDPIAAGGIVSSNGPMLAGMVRAAGGEPVLLPVAGDSLTSIAGAFASVRADLLVTTGGASVGAHDLVREGLGLAGFALDFWKIAMRPGKPMLFGHLGDSPVLGLPGNPVSAFVCASLFLLPALHVLSGLPGGAPRVETARLGAAMRANDQRADHVRARLEPGPDGTPVATPFERQDSAMLSVLAQAGALILRQPHAPAVEAGALVEIIRLEGGI